MKKRYSINLEYDYEGDAKDEYEALGNVLRDLYNGDLELLFAVSDADDETSEVVICRARGWKRLAFD